MVEYSNNHDYLKFDGDKEIKKIIRDGKSTYLIYFLYICI